MKQMIDQLYEWNFWGNRRCLAMLTDNGGGTPEMLRWISHILTSERVWLLRLQGESSSHLELFSSHSRDECESMLAGNERDWKSFLAGLDPEELCHLLHYANQSGAEFSTVVGDILLHVTSHGHYHRGQINAAARAQGWEPVLTDYIVFLREMEKSGTA